MSLERDIKDALGRHAEDARPNLAGFDAIERKVARAHRRRLAAISAASAVVVAALAFALPRALPDQTPSLADSSDPPVDATATAQAVDLKFFRNERDSYQLSIPEAWFIGRYEATVELLPPNQMGRTAGEDGFSVELQQFIGEAYDKPEDGYTFSATDDLGGRKAVRAERLGKDGTREVVYRIEWTGAGCPRHVLCDSEIATLRISILGTTADLWDRFDQDAQMAVDSIETTQRASVPTGVVTTLYGTIDADAAPYDLATEFFVRFMDARVSGDHALPFMTQQAEDDFSARKDVRFYTCCTPEMPWQSYFVVQREAADANSFVYLVELVSRDVDGNEVVAHEEIGVGADRGSYKVRFSEIRHK